MTVSIYQTNNKNYTNTEADLEVHIGFGVDLEVHTIPQVCTDLEVAPQTQIEYLEAAPQALSEDLEAAPQAVTDHLEVVNQERYLTS